MVNREALNAGSRRYRATPHGKLKILLRQRTEDVRKQRRLYQKKQCPKCGKDDPKDYRGKTGIHFHHTHGYERENWLKGEWECRECHRSEHGTGWR